ncbi:nucleoside diphosphate kinase regulator [Rhizobium leguminosarum bv. trifolii CB782]|uniref:Nucleoside diphosphate kinase regulator n=1 Tax=Rhizobium hidalgonense TaxID=1538159 RepID=A0A2A6K7F7_9HYPH|nr:nucleoside diphosphate kinase regulator [Rhizobium hidalgonense]AHG47453.1 nucleoside diphosphate kinase regulator [Rhizobium leguminosarum bv. trifolii CB782]MDR9776506.1 nucleoside diphosphate kinase regulator [Rhizobium hidalgonense]MDR9806824.1 nucleoside diphosphate kinase regulator [Rhizobium hidalgonense]MDR9814306.1 nucleoside diphosphate kinase regulator [Rhizobium hidalgonense]MDR9823043.1 nucleoside diphosphate kinase regulator [Rhizobium hidalgonense]
MKTHSQTPRKPPIVIGDTDYRRLNKLALAAADRLPEISDALLLELERARVASDSSVPEKVVRMGSAVEYKTDAGAQRIVTLVFPEDADISEGKISILTPIGTALLGLSTGQTMGWTARDNSQHKLTVLAVNEDRAEAKASVRPGR